MHLRAVVVAAGMNVLTVQRTGDNERLTAAFCNYTPADDEPVRQKPVAAYVL